MSDPSTVQAFAFKTIFGKDYAIVCQGETPSGGDAHVFSFPILEDGKHIFTASVAISGTVWDSQWSMKLPGRGDLLIKMCFARLSTALEKEELTPESNQLKFTTTNASHGLELEVKRAEAAREAIRREISEFVKIAASSRQSSAEKSLTTMREHVEFQERKAAELRGVYLQLASVSAVIVGAVLALNAPFSPVVSAALLMLATVVIGCFWRVSSVLQNLSRQLFDSHKAIQSLYESIIAEDSKFLNAPSYKGIGELKECWNRSIKEAQKTPKIEKVTLDFWLISIQVLFSVAILFLFAAYALRAKEKAMAAAGSAAGSAPASTTLPKPAPISTTVVRPRGIPK